MKKYIIFLKLNIEYFFNSHVGDGNFHVILPIIDSETAPLDSTIASFYDRLVKRALEAGGTCTGEHGVGLGKKKYLKAQYGESTVDMMKVIKTALDPHYLFNPDKIFDYTPTKH